MASGGSARGRPAGRPWRIPSVAMDLHTVTALEPAEAAPGTAREHRTGDAWLAGGTWLFSEPQPQLRRLLDVTALGWAPLVEDAAGLHVAATATITELARWAGRSRHRAAPLVVRCADAFLAGWKVQGAATVGGNIATALPAAPVVSLAAALDATAQLWAPDGSVRHLPVAALVTGDRTTALAPGELLREVLLPAASLAATTAVRRHSLTPLGRSASLVVARRDPGGARVLTLTAATRRPVQLRWPAGEEPAPARAAAALDAAVPAGLWHDDVHGHPAWRRAMALRAAEDVLAELASPGPGSGAPAGAGAA